MLALLIITTSYLIHHKSEVFQVFHTFQSLVERTFNRKILAMQTDWGSEYKKLNTFFYSHWDFSSSIILSHTSGKWNR
jgi:hypothetical protein